jgi:membrane protease YdiL (CAAX protease family)
MVLVVGVSFAFAWLRLASGSIWPAVLLHAVHNKFIQGVLDVITVDTGKTQYFTTEFGLGLAITGLIVGLVFWKIGLPKEREQESIKDVRRLGTSKPS